MEELLLKAYELATVLAPFFISLISLNILKKKRGIAEARGSFFNIACVLFSVYIFGVFHYTDVGTLFHILRYGFFYRPEYVNLVPFSAEVFDAVAYLLNVVLFMPLGFLLPLLWPYFRNGKRVFAAGLALNPPYRMQPAIEQPQPGY